MLLKEGGDYMKIIYECEKCGAQFSLEAEVLKCEEQLANPLYKIGEKVKHRGLISKVVDRRIVPYIHTFIYRVDASFKDNPGKFITVCGWINEEEIESLEK